MTEREPSPPTRDDASPIDSSIDASRAAEGTTDVDQLFNCVLEQVCNVTGCDFRPYKKSMIRRRIERRMALACTSDLAGYVHLLEQRPDEAQRLLQDLLISVTAFFREPETFRILEEQAIPDIVKQRSANAPPIRVWVPGCATGEEAYTLAMLFHEALGDKAASQLQVFATDIDRRALEFARAGRYPNEISTDIDEHRLQRFFHKQPDRTYRVRKSLRESIVFAPQNLLTDPPFLRLNLICCRNLMIYLEPDIQARLLSLFHMAIADEGYLVLGHSESVGRKRELFAPVADERRVYHKLPAARRQPAAFPVLTGAERTHTRPTPPRRVESHSNLGETIRRIVMQEYAPACVAINGQYEILHLHGPTRRYLHLPEGEPSLNLLSMLDEPAQHRLRAGVHETLQTRRPVAVTAATSAGSSLVRMTVRPVNQDTTADAPVLMVVFEDAFSTGSHSPSADGDGDGDGSDLDRKHTIAQLEHELSIVREDLQATIDQFECSNDQLRSSNEQVMSMNEELQSANEELETSQEELQSLNEELRSLNTQLQEKVDQLEQANNDISNFLASTDIATVFLDTDLCIKRFTPSAARLLGLETSDRGRPINRAMMRLTDESLLGEAAAVLDRLSPVEKEIRTATGTWYTMRVLPYRTAQNRIEGVVLTFTDVTRLRDLVDQSQCRVAQQAVVAELGQRALEGTDLQLLMDEATKAVARTLCVEYAKVLELLPGRMELLLRSGVGWEPGMVGHARVDAGLDSQAGYTLAVGTPVVVDDLGNEQRFSGPPLLRHASVISGLSVVIQGSHRPFGVLGVHSVRPRRFTQEDVNFIQSVAHILSQAVARKTFEDELKNLNRQLEKNVEQRTAWLRLMQTTTAAANESSGLASAVRQVLEQVCRTGGWMVGLAFLPDEAEGDNLLLLDCATAEQIEDDSALTEAVRRSSIRRGVGLVGRVYQTGRPAWSMHESEEPLIRTLRAQEQAVRTAMALPVWAGDQVVAVLEFFSERNIQPDDRLIEVMTQIGTQLGRVVERERAAKHLRDSEHFINSVADTAPLLFVVVDLIKSQLIYANSQVRTMLGYTEAQLQAMDRGQLVQLFHEDDRAAFRRLLEQLADAPAGTVIDAEYRLRHSDGDWRWFEARVTGFTRTEEGGVAQVLGTLEDITERRRAEEALGESVQRFRAVFESTQLGIALINPDGKLAEANLAMQQMLGYNEAQLRQLTIHELTHEDERGTAEDRCIKLLTGEAEYYDMQKRLVHKDGRAIWVQCNASLIRDRTGAPLYAIAITQDITDQKDLDAALTELSLREQQRIGQELHDNLGQELTGLSFMAQNLRNQLREEGRGEAERVHELAEGLRRALENVRAVARGLYPVDLDSSDLVEALTELVRTTEAQYGIACRLDARTEAPKLERHATNHLFRVVQEAMRNAVKHAQPSRIEVCLARDEQARFEILVADDGCGMPDDAIKMEGIGLRIMHHRASVIGADLSVEPRDQGGTCVRCTFREK
ncbi:CheR family methyltransferase [Phycisphaerales bacterium AB-hyl4]|uniref:CheR family methyltransferase n=1 Tax=Natronomicrosphaera hydrolytica TaxID=3242702 RepID=A0ABV4UA93_9BACT